MGTIKFLISFKINIFIIIIFLQYIFILKKYFLEINNIVKNNNIYVINKK